MPRNRSVWRKIFVCFGILALMCAGVFFWLRYELSHLSFNFTPASKTELDPLLARLKAEATSVVVMKQANSNTRATSVPYRDLDLQADARLFEAWQGAVKLGIAALEHTEKGNWVKSSIAADYISPEKRLDPWNHPFCLLRRDEILLIVSAGPEATGSPVCKNIEVESSELATLPAMRLIQSPAGNLVLMMRAQPQQRTQ